MPVLTEMAGTGNTNQFSIKDGATSIGRQKQDSYNLNQSRLNLTVTYKKNKFVTENRLSYDNIRKGHQEQTGIA